LGLEVSRGGRREGGGGGGGAERPAGGQGAEEGLGGRVGVGRFRGGEEMRFQTGGFSNWAPPSKGGAGKRGLGLGRASRWEGFLPGFMLKARRRRWEGLVGGWRVREGVCPPAHL
jgi:hypothetical protein